MVYFYPEYHTVCHSNSFLRWVGSHATGTEVSFEEGLNNLADKHAVDARKGNTNVIKARECYSAMPSFFLETKCDREIIESIPHTPILNGVATRYIERNYEAACQTSKRLTTSREIISNAPDDTAIFFGKKISSNTNEGMFMFNLLYSNLQNPHDNFVSHQKSFPHIYPTDTCPLCHHPRADLKHIFCSCPVIDSDRTRALRSTTTEISTEFKTAMYNLNVQDWLREATIPNLNNNTFTHGIISRTNFTLLEVVTHGRFLMHIHGPSKIQSLAISYLFFPIWNAYNDKLRKSKNSFAQRLRKSYNISPSEKHMQASRHF